jgi:RNA polymerase sigma factor (sigma-70 family)
MLPLTADQSHAAATHYQHTRPVCLGLRRRFSLRRDEALDAAADAAIQAAIHPEYTPAIASIYAMKTTRRRIFGHVARCRESDGVDVRHNEPWYEVEDESFSPSMAAAVAELSDGQWQAIELSVIHGLSRTQAGEAMGVKPETVQTQLTRAKARMRARLAG